MAKTAKGIIQAAYDAFVKEGKPPSFQVDSGAIPVCLYRGPDGARCGIGVQLPDAFYRKAFDKGGGMSIRNIMEDYGEVREYFGSENIEVLDTVQECHDVAVRVALAERGQTDVYDTELDNEYFRDMVEKYLLNAASRHEVQLDTI